MTTIVRLQDRTVAVAGPSRYYLSSELAERAAGDPERKLVALMCGYAHRLDLAGRSDEYTDQSAEAFARVVLDMASQQRPG
jgi:hypothetical protein